MAAATEYAAALADGYVTAMPQRFVGLRYSLMIRHGHQRHWESQLIWITRAEEEQLAAATRKARAWWCLWRLEALAVEADVATDDEVRRAELRLLSTALVKRGRTLH